jgi:hypothetical protein
MISVNKGQNKGLYFTDWLRTFWPNIRQLDSSRSDEFKCFVHILGFLYTDTRILVVPAQRGIT